MRLANCVKCRRIFQRTASAMCPECHRVSQSQVSSAYRFIQQNPHLTLEEVADHCLIPYRDLEQMLFDGKLGLAASNVIYHCQRCGRPTDARMRRGHFCVGCADRIENAAGLHQLVKKEPEKRNENSKILKRPEAASESPLPPAETGEVLWPEKDLGTLKPASSTSQADSHGFKRITE
jgi:hypothetical protein